jgi:hypothetical protein
MNRKTFLASLAAAFVACKLPRVEPDTSTEMIVGWNEKTVMGIYPKRRLVREGLPNEGVTPSRARVGMQISMPPERRWFSLDEEA